MKVLQINATYGYGSTGLIAKDIGDMLTDAGHDAFYAYQSCLDVPQNGYRVGGKLDWKWHALACRIFGKQGYYSKAATRKLLKHIAKIKPDVVHLHNLHSNYIHLNTLLDFLAKKDIATVITLHDCWYFTGKCFHYADVGCDRFQSGCGQCPKKKAPPKSLFFDASTRVLKDRYRYLSSIPRLTVVGCSDWVCGEAKKGVLKDAHITRIYNGVDTEIFKPYENNILKEAYKDECFYILGMANKWLLPANAPLLEETVKTLDENCKLVLIGCTEEQAQSLKAKSANIIPTSFVKDRKKLAEYYSAADVFVNATHVDTLPTVNMESICCGTPVITYDVTGSPELISDGCGKVVKENDIFSLLTWLDARPEKIAAETLPKARVAYDKNKCYKEYLTVYEDLLK